MAAKARIRQNKWDNWYGYIGNKRVIDFANTPEYTMEQNAKRWLADQLAGKPFSKEQVDAEINKLILQAGCGERLVASLIRVIGMPLVLRTCTTEAILKGKAELEKCKEEFERAYHFDKAMFR